MLKITVKPAFGALGKAFKEIKLEKQIQTYIEKLSYKTEAEAKKVTPVLTGFLRASIQTRIGTLQGEIRPFAPYAYSVHEGLGTNRRKGRRPFLERGFMSAFAGLGTEALADNLDKHIQTILNKVK